MTTLDTVPQRNSDRQQRAIIPVPDPPTWEEPGSVADKIARTIFGKTPLWWYVGFSLSSILMAIFFFTIASVTIRGTGLWGIDIPVVWGMAIVNLIFWIGIGHAGTFISAFLLLMRQSWRVAFSRFAEAMTLFALAVAGLFPLIHLGRIEFAYYILPYPNTLNLFSQWRSPLVWDMFAISTYGIISALFWYIDLIPDLATMRDRAQTRWVRWAFAIPAMGWRGDAQHWEGLHKTAFFLAVLATPLVVSVHSIVGLDFAISNLPGWHHTIFPPFFVAGAVFSGMAMVMIFAVILRSGFNMKNLITEDHLNKAGILMLITGLLVTYGYFVETFGAWFSGDVHEWALTVERSLGTFAPAFWGMIFFNAVVIQLFWFRRFRTNHLTIVVVSVLVLVGMWLERFVIVPVSLSYPFMEAVWDPFTFGIWDWLTLVSPFGLFLTPLFLFIRFVPVIPIAETQAQATEEAHHDEH